MEKSKQIKIEKAVDKMLGINRIYINLQKPLILGEGDRINISGRMGRDGEIIAGSIQITREFTDISPYGGHAVLMPSYGTPTVDCNTGTKTPPTNPAKGMGGRGAA